MQAPMKAGTTSRAAAVAAGAAAAGFLGAGAAAVAAASRVASIMLFMAPESTGCRHRRPTQGLTPLPSRSSGSGGDLYPFHAPRGAAADRDRGFRHAKAIGEERNQLLVGGAIHRLRA